MANVLANTEDWSVAEFNDGVTVTTNTTAAPAFAGPNAGLADTLTDAEGANQSSIYRYAGRGVPDSSDWFFSVFIRKDADLSRFPNIVAGFLFGAAQKFRGISVNTMNGSVQAGSPGSPADSGVIDVDDKWWRFWLRESDASDNSHVGLLIFPARGGEQGSSDNSAVTGSVIAWGANITKGSTLENYDPNPAYQLPIAPTSVASAGGWTVVGAATIPVSIADVDNTTYMKSGAGTPDPITLQMAALDTPSGTVTVDITARVGT